MLSPCKVRNLIQSELGFTQTKVGNKSKSTVGTSNCSIYEVATNTIVKKKSQSQQTPSITINSNFVVSRIPTTHSQSYQASNHSTATVPLYILYQNFKDYL